MAQKTERTIKKYYFYYGSALVGQSYGRDICEARRACRGVKFTSWRATHLEDKMAQLRAEGKIK